MVVYGLPPLSYKLTFYFENHLMPTNLSIESYEVATTILKYFDIDPHYNSNVNAWFPGFLYPRFGGILILYCESKMQSNPRFLTCYTYHPTTAMCFVQHFHYSNGWIHFYLKWAKRLFQKKLSLLVSYRVGFAITEFQF